MTLEIRFRRIATNGVTLNVAEAGPLDGPLVILLHGFPESSSGWKAQIGPLAEAGYRVLAPDQRGYAESDKPRGIAAYALDVLVEDLIGLIDSEGRKRASVVGHDWGGRGRLGGDCPPPLAIRSGGDPQRPASRRDGPRGPIEPIATPQKLVCHRLPAPVVARDVASSKRFSMARPDDDRFESSWDVYRRRFRAIPTRVVVARGLDLDGELVSGGPPDQTCTVLGAVDRGVYPGDLGRTRPISRQGARPIELRRLRRRPAPLDSRGDPLGPARGTRAGEPGDPRMARGGRSRLDPESGETLSRPSFSFHPEDGRQPHDLVRNRKIR